MSHTKVGMRVINEPDGTSRQFDMLRCECGAEFFFAPSEKDKAIPLCKEPVPNGNIFIREGRAIYISKRNPLPDPEQDRFQSHFADCPKAEQFRTQGSHDQTGVHRQS